MQDKILDWLKKKQGYISGDQLSQRLGISRQALWKHIHQLKDAGYDIVAMPHLGYQLISSPDRLFPSEVEYDLNTKVIGKKIYYFDTVSSTMDIAVGLGIKGAQDGTLVLAETQTKGKGRLGRSWFSPKYKGIYMSLVLRPKLSPDKASLLTLLVAVSVCEAMKNSLDLDVQIKWPNDLVIRNKKLGGILTELNAEVDQVRFVVIGLGLNVNNDRNSLLPGATSVQEQKKAKLERVNLLREILRRIEDNYMLFEKAGGKPIIEKWHHYNVTLGRRVKVYFGRQHLEGQAVDIDSDGALLLRNDLGLVEKITAGDVVHCR